MSKDDLIDDIEILSNCGENKNEKSKEFIELLISSILFGFGYIMVSVNGYYYYKYYDFIQIGRKDLIARLGFLSYATGYLFYPNSIMVYTSLI